MTLPNFFPASSVTIEPNLTWQRQMSAPTLFCSAASPALQKVSHNTDGSWFSFGHPHRSCTSWMSYFYFFSLPDLVSPPSTSYACEGSTLTLSCPRPGLALRVIRANFGRFSVAVCNDDVRANLSVNCMAPRTLRIMQNR